MGNSLAPLAAKGLRFLCTQSKIPTTPSSHFQWSGPRGCGPGIGPRARMSSWRPGQQLTCSGICSPLPLPARSDGISRGLLFPLLRGGRPSLQPAPLGPGDFPNPHWSLGPLAPRRASWVPTLPSARACPLLEQPDWLLAGSVDG